jgi:dTDP-4-dehydrorhamnose reductase
MKPKILITGGSGFLAQNWAQAAKIDYDVVLCKHNRDIKKKEFKVKSLNLDSVIDIKTYIEKIHPDFVVHTAGLADVERCEVDPNSAYYLNVQLAKNISIACSEVGIPLVHISTDHLFDGKRSFVEEGALVSPINMYAKTKSEAEVQVLKQYPKALVIRTNFYGWGTSYKKSFSDLIIYSLRKKKYITLFCDVFYTPILIEKLVFTSHELIKANASGIFNIVGDDRVSKYDFGLIVAKKFDLDPSLIYKSQIYKKTNFVKRPLDMSLSNKKVSEFLDKKMGGLEEHLFILKEQEHLLNLESLI